MHIAQSTLWSDIYDCGFLHCSSFPSECQFNCKQMYFVDYFVGKWNHLDIICLVCSADRDRKCLPFSKLYRHFKLVNPGSAPRQENNELFPILWASVTWLNDSLCWLTVLFRLTFDPHQWTAHSLFKWPVPSSNERGHSHKLAKVSEELCEKMRGLPQEASRVTAWWMSHIMFNTYHYSIFAWKFIFYSSI